MKDDAELLRDYAENGSEQAFAELVSRHIDLVYAAALRRTGDRHRAADVTQEVFTNLAQQSPRLVKHPALAGWLHTATRNTAINVMIEDKRRRLHESEAATHAITNTPSEANLAWDQLRPVLDDAIDGLPEPDRIAIVLRFLYQQPFASVGVALQVSEDAARMRTDRALEKLRSRMTRRGLSSSSAALTALVTGLPLVSAPAGLGTIIVSHALASANPSVISPTLFTIMKTKLVAATTVAALTLFVAGGFFYQSTVLSQSSPASTQSAANKSSAIGKRAKTSGNISPYTADTETFLESLIRQGLGGQRGPALIRFRALPLADLPAILREIELMEESPKKMVLLADFHEAWAEHESMAALDSALKYGADPTRGVLAGWARISASEAWSWINRPETKTIATNGDMTSFYRVIVTTLAKQNDENVVADLLDTLPPTTLRMTLAGQLAETWAAKAPEDLSLWLQRNESKDKDATGFAANYLGMELARKGPDTVINALNTQSEFIGNAIVGAAVSQWTKAGQNESTDAMLRSLSGISIERADVIFAQAGYATASKDPASGLALMMRIQTPEARNRWLSTGASLLMQSSPSNAMEFAVAISDAAARDTRAKRVYSQWLAKDPVAAHAGIESEGFPQSLRETLTAGEK